MNTSTIHSYSVQKYKSNNIKYKNKYIFIWMVWCMDGLSKYILKINGKLLFKRLSVKFHIYT